MSRRFKRFLIVAALIAVAAIVAGTAFYDSGCDSEAPRSLHPECFGPK